MKLEDIDVRRNTITEDGKERRLRISVWYDNGKDYPYNKKGIYVSIMPISVSYETGHNGIKYEMYEYPLYAGVEESGFKFCAIPLERASAKKQKDLHTRICKHKGFIKDLFENKEYDHIITCVDYWINNKL